MPGDQPFIAVTASVAGKSTVLVAVSTSGIPGTVDSTGGYAAQLLVTNCSNTVTLFVRMTQEATPLATSLDVPIPPVSSRVFENPNPVGKTGVAVAGSVFGLGTTPISSAVVFTPGNGGIE